VRDHDILWNAGRQVLDLLRDGRVAQKADHVLERVAAISGFEIGPQPPILLAHGIARIGTHCR
jgi:hypothetical protein